MIRSGEDADADVLGVDGEEEGREEGGPGAEELPGEEVDGDDRQRPQDRGGDGGYHLHRPRRSHPQEEGGPRHGLVEEGGPKKLQPLRVVDGGIKPESRREVVDGVEDPPHVVEGVGAVEEDVSADYGAPHRGHPQKEAEKKDGEYGQMLPHVSSIQPR